MLDHVGPLVTASGWFEERQTIQGDRLVGLVSKASLLVLKLCKIQQVKDQRPKLVDPRIAPRQNAESGDEVSGHLVSFVSDNLVDSPNRVLQILHTNGFFQLGAAHFCLFSARSRALSPLHLPKCPESTPEVHQAKVPLRRRMMLTMTKVRAVSGAAPAVESVLIFSISGMGEPRQRFRLLLLNHAGVF